MFKNNHLLSTLLLSTFFVQFASAAAPAPSAYPYMASLNAGPVEIEQRVQATLPSPSLRLIRTDYGNVQVLDDLNGEVNFIVFDEPAGPVRNVNAVELSTISDEQEPKNLFDDNRLTTFAFDQPLEANSPATIMVDFGKLVELHRIELWPTFESEIAGMELRAGNSKDSLSTLKRRTVFSPIIDSDYAPLRWLEIKLWGTNVTLEDVNFFKKPAAKVYFTAQPERRYRLLFGDMNLDNKRFSERLSSTQPSDQQFNFANYKFNPLASEDFDGDSIPNETDNCPLVSNKTQTDQDGDRIGDPCDNAVEVKNYSQLDVDRDGVADLIDNCKLLPNPDQKNRDKDEFGDECDNAYAKESVFEKWTGSAGNSNGDGSIPYSLIGMILALVAILGIGVTVAKKK
ncbi:hypothetical protein GW832_04075 [bacterium]|nr:hypothetical protein [bacterium]